MPSLTARDNDLIILSTGVLVLDDIMGLIRNELDLGNIQRCVLASKELRQVAHARFEEVNGLEEHFFDLSYMDFLHEQIQLNAHGKAWGDRLCKRRDDLKPYVNHVLIRARISVPGGEISFEVDPSSSRVIHWEDYQSNASE